MLTSTKFLTQRLKAEDIRHHWWNLCNNCIFDLTLFDDVMRYGLVDCGAKMSHYGGESAGYIA